MAAGEPLADDVESVLARLQALPSDASEASAGEVDVAARLNGLVLPRRDRPLAELSTADQLLRAPASDDCAEEARQLLRGWVQAEDEAVAIQARHGRQVDWVQTEERRAPADGRPVLGLCTRGDTPLARNLRVSIRKVSREPLRTCVM